MLPNRNARKLWFHNEIAWILLSTLLQLACTAAKDGDGPAAPELAGSGQIAGALSQPLQAPFAPAAGPLTPSQCFNGTLTHNSAALQYGIDYIMPIGTDVLAVGPGKVAFTNDTCANNQSACVKGVANATCDCFHGIGNVVVVEHGPGDYSLYAHLNKGSLLVAVGQQVCTGQVLAKSGWSGWGTGAHLHFQMQSTAGGATTLADGYVSKSFDGWYQPSGGLQNPCGALTSYNNSTTSCASAVALPINQVTNGAVAKGEWAKYSFNKLAGKAYSVQLHPLGGDPDLYGHFDPAVSASNFQHSSVNGAGSDDVIKFSASADGVYYIAVLGYSAATYTLKVVESAGDDHGNTAATATPVALGATTSGSIEVAGDVDFFSFKTVSAGSIAVSTSGTTDTYCYLIDANGKVLAEDDDSGPGTNCLAAMPLVPAATYFAKVRHYSSGSGPYAVQATATGSAPPSYSCPGNCSGHGTCNTANGLCTCSGGYSGSNCATPPSYSCPGNCSGHGTCNTANGLCTCSGGYSGSDCATPPSYSCPGNCSGHGTCNTANGLCTCSGGYSGSNCATPPSYSCPGNCSGHGTCNTANGLCTCSGGYSGSNCATPPAVSWNCANSSYNGAQYWTCSGSERYRCVGGVPQKESCGNYGCFKRSAGKDDLCAVADPAWNCANSSYAGAQYWTCKSDGKLHKCSASSGIAVQCPQGCGAMALGVNDICP